jgi:transketolase C-terminal domain/subunit
VVRPDLEVTPIAIGSGCIYGSIGFALFAVEDLARTRVLPGISIFGSSIDESLRTAFSKIMSVNRPKYLRLDCASATIATKDFRLRLENSTVLDDGKDVTIFALGSILDKIIVAAKILEECGISIRIVSAGLIKPATKEMISSHAAEKLSIAVVQE